MEKDPARRAVLALLACVFSTEILLRVAVPPAPDPQRLFADEAAYLYGEAQTPYFRLSRDRWEPARPRALPGALPVQKKPEEIRIIVIGESVARRLGVEAVREAFQDAFPNKNAVALNAGMGTYASAQWSRVFEESLQRSPDVIVLLAGNNEGLRPDRLWLPAFRANLFLRRSRAWRALQDGVGALFVRAPDSRGVDPLFEARLRAAAKSARSRSVLLVLATLPVNLRDFPPAGPAPRDADYAADTVDSLSRFVARRPSSAMGHYRLAIALSDAGDAVAARREFSAAVDLDEPGRTTAARNELVRRVAREEGAALADLEALFANRAPGGVPGWEAFGDGVHPRPALNRMIATALADAAVGADPAPLLKSPSAPAWTPGPELDALVWTGLSEALQAGLRRPPFLDERAVAELEQVARVSPETLRALIEDPSSLSRALDAGDWTRPLAPYAASALPSLRLHADEAFRRSRLPVRPRPGKLL